MLWNVRSSIMDINPQNQSIRDCLGKTYSIDFYQREYVWDKQTVEILLNDIFHQFELSYEEHKDKKIESKTMSKYNWYYLSTYITNKIESEQFIVDGQQRLTTLSLIALKLYHSTKEEKVRNVLSNLIKGDDMDKGRIFWIDHENREKVMNALMDGKPLKESELTDITSKNVHDRYKEISAYFDKKALDDKKLKSFIYYFLYNLVLVELEIKQDDTPMIFEVINDRGVALKPFEILKGKLLGALDKSDTEKYNNCWEDAISRIKYMEDDFFRNYLKAKFMSSKNPDVEKRINNDYHRYIFEDNEMAKKLKFRKTDEDHKGNIKEFIEKNMSYYTALYEKIINNTDKNIYLIYNHDINGLSGQYQNIMAACEINDEQEQEKIEAIAKEVDRLFILLSLNNIYDSNNFQNISYSINESVKGKQVNVYRDIFNEKIYERIREKYQTSNSVLSYHVFKKQGYDTLNAKILRYILARIEEYICKNSKINMQTDIFHLSTKTRSANSNYHIEHIFADNEENKAYFKSEDENVFWEERNRLGALLLLKGKDNQSSGNEQYKNKLKTYSNGLMLCRTLTQDCYKSNLDFTKWNDTLEEPFKPIDTFDRNALEHRSKVLYTLVKRIWDV